MGWPDATRSKNLNTPRTVFLIAVITLLTEPIPGSGSEIVLGGRVNREGDAYGTLETKSVQHCTSESCEADGTLEACVDSEDSCTRWAADGECEANPSWMLSNCRKSCAICDDHLPHVYESINVDIMRHGESFGKVQELDSRRARKVLQTSFQHVIDFYSNNGADITCENKDELCSKWAAFGQCEVHTAWMKENCAPACLSCGFLKLQNDCPIDRATDALKATGDLNALFERILSEDRFQKLQPVAHTMPRTHNETSEYYMESDGSDELYDDLPWVMTFENFTTKEEAQRLIDLGYGMGFQPSTTGTGKVDAMGFPIFEAGDPGRTSTTTWCGDDCYNDPMHLAVLNRIADVLQIPHKNYEHMQLLKYEAGQFYGHHHDYITDSNENPCGPRIFTFFLYLNDVESDDLDRNGGTRFTQILRKPEKSDEASTAEEGGSQEGGADASTTEPGGGARHLTVQPRVGRALLWPSVLNSDPGMWDPRTEHEALPVPEGSKKFAANVWVHLRQYQDTHGCCGV